MYTVTSDSYSEKGKGFQMALVSIGFELDVTLVDYGGNESNKHYQMTAATYDDAVTDVAIIAPALINMTDAVISKYSIREVYENNALTLPTTVNPVSVRASMTTFLGASGSKKADFDVPSPRIGIFVAATGAGADVVDNADAAVIAYHALFVSGGQLFISDGERAGILIGGVRVSNSRRLA